MAFKSLNRRGFIKASAAVAAGAAFPMPALAQKGKSDTLTIILNSAPGGPSDITLRILQEPLGKELNRSVVIDFKAGAGGALGLNAVSRAPKDGSTIAWSFSGPGSYYSTVVKDLGYDPGKDLAPITLFSYSPQIFGANPKFPANDIAGLIELAKKSPGSIKVANGGKVSPSGIAVVKLAKLAKIDIVSVPYSGGNPAVQAAVAGEVPVYSSAYGSLPEGLVKEGRLKVLGVGTKGRWSLLPNYPSVDETVPGFTANVSFGFVAPAGTPPDIIRSLNAAITKVIMLPDVKPKLVANYFDPMPSTPEEYGAIIKREIEEDGPILASLQ
ncbi:MAG: Bug family tripartite tricarboxylate transporter substrate binding protein [Reyranellaceae bacterium]